MMRSGAAGTSCAACPTPSSACALRASRLRPSCTDGTVTASVLPCHSPETRLCYCFNKLLTQACLVLIDNAQHQDVCAFRPSITHFPSAGSSAFEPGYDASLSSTLLYHICSCTHPCQLYAYAAHRVRPFIQHHTDASPVMFASSARLDSCNLCYNRAVQQSKRGAAPRAAAGAAANTAAGRAGRAASATAAVHRGCCGASNKGRSLHSCRKEHVEPVRESGS